MTREQLVASAEALLALDARGALAPHGIGGHAREIIQGFLDLPRPSLSTDGDGLAKLLRLYGDLFDSVRGIPTIGNTHPGETMRKAADALSRTPKAEPSEEARENMHKFARVFGEGIPGELLPVDAFPPAAAPQAQSEPVAWRYDLDAKVFGEDRVLRGVVLSEREARSAPHRNVIPLYASPQPQPVAIKPLVWLDDQGNDKDFHAIHAQPPLAYYAIWWFRSGPYCLKQSGSDQVRYNTLDAAKAAAQADYASRIRTALATPPAQGDMALEGTRIVLIDREDGGLRVLSPDLPGLILSGGDPAKVAASIPAAIKGLREFASSQDTPSEER